VVRRLRASGCDLAAIPAGEGSGAPGSEGFGSNGPAILALREGRLDAYLAPHVSLHDFAGPWCLAAAAGCAVVKFRTSDPAAPHEWVPEPEPRFEVPSAANYPQRFRILIARTRNIAERLVGILQGIR
jgi:fructose-1,6-bisphosphatase/inositol monophosphatase family enzyme